MSGTTYLNAINAAEEIREAARSACIAPPAGCNKAPAEDERTQARFPLRLAPLAEVQ